MRRPNILILYTDQQRWDALGANGNSDIKTPHLDRLAEQGICFDHYFVQNPVCMPSRLSFLTGQYPSTLGITHMGVPVPPETIVLPHILRNYGYTSANIGKLHFLPHANRDHQETHPSYGFDHLEISDEPGCYEDAYRAWVRRKEPAELKFISLGLPPRAATWHQAMGIKDTVEHPPERFPKHAQASRANSELTHAAFVAEQTMEFIRMHRHDTWMCIAGFYSPHSPWVAPQEFLDLYDPDQLSLPQFPPEVDARRSEVFFSDTELRSARHGYYAMVSEVDHHVGRLLSCLTELGLADDTVVVFTSDHGEWLGEHLRYGKGHPGLDPVSRVPLLIGWPGGIDSPGRRVSGIAEGVDVVPTLLQCAGIPIPPHLQGCSLYPVLKDTETETSTEAALMEHSGWKNLRTHEFRYVHQAAGPEMLFDLRNDPHEYRNVAQDPSYASALSDMRKRLLDRLLGMERPKARIWPY